MIETFVFDIGNVLLPFDFSRALVRLAADSEIHDPVEILARVDQIKLGYEDGQIDRASFLRGVFDVLQYRGTEGDFIAAWEDIFDPNEAMFDLVEKLHGRYPLYLLSNTGDIHREYFFRQYPVFQRFSGGVYSYEVRLLKPHREIYEATARQFGINPATTFFVDDLLPNIESAREFGFQPHHYHQGRHEALLADIRSAGVLV